MTAPGRECSECKTFFWPKPRGFNAKYCSYKCKCRSKRTHIRATKPEQLINARARSYKAIKSHPDRLGKHRASNRKQRQKAREWLANYKLERGCVDCGYKRHYAALQLDHEGVKSISIGEARSSIKRLKQEIEAGNCKVRCANCHSIKTWERKQVKQ